MSRHQTRSRLTLLLAALALLCAVAARAEPTTRPVGVWYQPVSSFAKWRARNVNLLIGYENEGGAVSADAWCKAARDAGFTYILQDSAASHWNDPTCVAVVLSPDEPNGGGARTPGQMMDAAIALRAKTSKPLFLNLDGWQLQYRTDAEIAGYCAPADWIAEDWYLAGHGDGLAALPQWTAQIDRLIRLAPGKHISIFIECCDQKLNKQGWAQQPGPDGKPWATRMHGPSIAEMQAQHDAARQRGCDIVWFPDVIGLGWEAFDGVTDLNAGAMTVLNGK